MRKAGFEVARVEGSHHFLRHPDGRGTVVPVHAGETIGPGLLAAILRDCELVRDNELKSPENAGMIVRSHVAFGGEEILIVGSEPRQFKKRAQGFSRRLEKLCRFT